MTEKISRKQKQILAFPNTDYDALICDGSIRAGKTAIMSMAFVMWAMRDFNNCNFGVCSKTIGTAERNVIKPLLATQYMTNKYTMQYVKDSHLLVTSIGKTNTFYLFGGKDESSYMLIQGITLAGVLLDEVALMPKSFVEQALARCSVDGRKFWFNCNPESRMHWFNQEWIMQPEKHNALHLHFTLDDNPSLSEKIKNTYKTMYSGVFYQRYILGQWVMTDGLIYDMFDESVHVGEPEKTEGEYFVSSDYGIQNATVFLLWRKEAGSSRWCCLNEYYYSGREKKLQKTVAELVDGLESMLDGIKPKRVIVDPSAAALIVELRKRGYSTKEAENSVLDGIADVSTMLKTGNLLFSPRCKNTINEFGLYIWDEKASNKGEDKPVKENDHGMDSVRYFVRTQKLVRKRTTNYYSVLE